MDFPCAGCGESFDLALLASTVPDLFAKYKTRRAEQKISYHNKTYCYWCLAWISSAFGEKGEEAICSECKKITCTRCKHAWLSHDESPCDTLLQQVLRKDMKHHILETHAGHFNLQKLFDPDWVQHAGGAWELCPACVRPLHPDLMGLYQHM